MIKDHSYINKSYTMSLNKYYIKGLPYSLGYYDR